MFLPTFGLAVASYVRFNNNVLKQNMDMESPYVFLVGLFIIGYLWYSALMYFKQKPK
jgi:hypothetical protein